MLPRVLTVIFWRVTVLLFCTVLAFAPLSAQQNEQRIYSVNQEVLFNQSAFGLRVRSDFDQKSLVVLTQNRKIEEDLKVEEQNLTDLRPELDPLEFRTLADAFDVKVEAIRKEQAQKTVELTSFREVEQNRFFTDVFPILVTLAEELNALAIIDARSVMISSDQFDITRLAISRVNEVLGDGAIAPVSNAVEGDKTDSDKP